MPLLRETVSKIKDELKDVDIVELGSGDCSKISILLEAIPSNIRETVRYLPIDISREAIEKSSDMLSKRFQDIQIHGVVSDFQTQLHLIPKEKRRIFCFFGSTIGNLSKEKAKQFLINLSNNMQQGDMFLLGVDMVKDKQILEKAYNDDKDITAEFNKNILNVVNNHLKTDFNKDDFDHVAFYNGELSRIEMHLKANRDLEVKSQYLDSSIIVKNGETIHTENSHKFTDEHIKYLAAKAQLKIQGIVKDKNRWFSVVQLTK
jgi:L-histidine N-alpha-methyltransferase